MITKTVQLCTPLSLWFSRRCPKAMLVRGSGRDEISKTNLRSLAGSDRHPYRSTQVDYTKLCSDRFGESSEPFEPACRRRGIFRTSASPRMDRPKLTVMWIYMWGRSAGYAVLDVGLYQSITLILPSGLGNNLECFLSCRKRIRVLKLETGMYSYTTHENNFLIVINKYKIYL